MSKETDFSRRRFLQLAGLGGAALCLGIFPGISKASVITEGAALAENVEMNAWIIINTSGRIKLVDHRAEMGQGSYHSVPQIIAEELEVDLSQVDVIFAQGSTKYGSQITGGSSTIRTSYKNLLKLSATAREMLRQAAAKRWNVPLSECVARSGNIIHEKTSRKFHYGELVAEASKLTPPENVELKPRSKYKIIGKPIKRIDTRLKTNGAAVFGLDKRLPGMLYASVERNPRLRGKVASFDDSQARKIKGVKDVIKITMKVWDTDREGVAVIADNSWAALQGRKALKVTWDDSGFDHINTADIYKKHQQLLMTEEGLTAKEQGSVDTAASGSRKKIEAVYTTPYQSHLAIEPINCIAHYQKDKIEIWGPIQAPDWIQKDVAKAFDMDAKNVTVNMTFLGGGFGRKAFTDYPNEAVAISKKINAPVQVVWSREDDATQGPFRPGVSYRGEGIIENGKLTDLKFRMVGQNINHWQSGKKGTANPSTTEGFMEPYFKTVKNIKFSDIPFETPVPVLWWRSVYASTNGFAYESFMDEIARSMGMDSLEFRRQYMNDERTHQLIDKLAEVSQWKSSSPQEGYGVAITECFKSTVGQVVKVSKRKGGGIKIDKVWAVIDCGWYVNPDIIEAQVEGSIVMALGATMHEQTFTDGKADLMNYNTYPLPRIYDIPPVEVHIMENKEDAGGVGEPGLPPFAPALANAIFDLTGKRIRTLPFDLAKL